MNRKPFCHVVLLLTLVKNISCEHRRTKRIVGGVAANFPPYDDPTVFVRFNGRAARVQGSREFPHYVFKGIKYAHPPIGRDRFLRPREKFLEGTVRATTYSPPCVQFIPGKNIVIGSEDCLALNIFTPDLPSGTEGLPVIIWIHGGGFRTGSASQYGVRHLVSKRLVVVTIQYRLGSLGFLSSGSKHLPGNAALWDMALAVQWVRNYIGFFGGNPHRIVVMGHGTGASSALLVALSKIAKGLPNSVIAMSGTAISRWSIDNAPLNTAHAIAEENGCPTASILTMVKCLQKLPAESIVQGDSNIEFARLQERGFVSGLDGKLGPTPVTEGVNDGRSLPGLVEHDPIRSLHAGDNPKIPLLTGVTKDETKRAVLGQFNSETISKLRQTAENINNKLVESLKYGIGLVRYNRKYTNGSGEDLGQGTQNWIPLEFNNYFKAPKNDISGQLNKIAEVTGDALFNVPAFLTAQFWKGAPAFLYSFEHIGKMNRGSSFLKGIPILGNFSTAG
ncbi:carboxylesterase 4A-like isoform X2 [Cylas formicarius]|uniref:carboxylesterase 4A-like isoform X2 n=1 Tax=Cylas formicarius TaxID=197179 RepID=UPI002958C28A|nr:carboxylesterase 4A-like isoform X2 [Cylas formicarius]